LWREGNLLLGNGLWCQGLGTADFCGLYDVPRRRCRVIRRCLLAAVRIRDLRQTPVVRIGPTIRGRLIVWIGCACHDGTVTVPAKQCVESSRVGYFGWE